MQKYVKIPTDFIKAPQKVQYSSHINPISSSALHPAETFSTFADEKYLLQAIISYVPGDKKTAQPFLMAGRKQNQKFTLKLNKQSFLKDTFPLLLFLLGSDFWLSPRIRESLKGNLKAISFLKKLTARGTPPSLSPCDDSRDGFLLSFQDVP